MPPPTRIVISASRRTDIPAFYMAWFMDRIEKGVFEGVNPYTRHATLIPAGPEKVHTLVFWSKNFGPFIDGGFGENLKGRGYNLFFNFTVNSVDPILEPHVPPLEARLDQLCCLSDRFGPKTINWRFDPICFHRLKDGRVRNNLHDFLRIAEHAKRSGILRCITSFMDHYPKISKRIDRRDGFSFLDPPMEEKIEVLLELERQLNDHGIALQTCCEKEVLEKLPSGSKIRGSACISNDLLMECFGERLSVKKDPGQRLKAGCGCQTSVDIGVYHLHPCFHNCLFCYANPSPRGPARCRI